MATYGPIYKGGVPYFKGGIRGGGTISKTSSQYMVDFLATLGAGVGNNTASLNGVFRGIIKGDTLTSTAVLMAGVHGVYWITTSNASLWPKAAVLAELHDSSKSADGAFVGVFFPGLTAGVTTTANAFFTGVTIGTYAGGSTLTYGLDFGLTLTGPTGIANVFSNADIRLTNDICFLHAAGTPTNGVSGTGAGFAGPGSEYVNISTGIPYRNTNTKASPTWVKTSAT